MARTPQRRDTRATATRDDDRPNAAEARMLRATEPTVQMREAPNRPGDPVTNAAEARMLEEQHAADEQREEEERQRQEEEARRQQELFEMRQGLMVGIIKSPEGFVVREEGNDEAISESLREGFIYQSNVQRGPGGLEVEERYFLSQKGYDALRTSLGPNMGK